MTIFKVLPQALLEQLPAVEVKVATTNGLFVRVFTEGNEVWEFRLPDTFVRKVIQPIRVVDESNIKNLRYPFGLMTWGCELSTEVTGCDHKLFSVKENGSGKSRISFTLEEDTFIAPHWAAPILIKRGRYDYVLPTPKKQDWSACVGLFND